MKTKHLKQSTRWRVVVDTSVMVSAFVYGGNPRLVVEKWLEEKFDLLISPQLLAEILVVLKRFKLETGEIEKIQSWLTEKTIQVKPKSRVKVCRDPADGMVLELCQDGRADYCVTGDKDLLTLKSFGKTKILKPKEF